MILLILVGIVVLVVGKVSITRSFRLTGRRARLYGVALIALAIPLTVLFRWVAPPLLSAIHLDNAVGYRIANFVFLASVLIVPALGFKSMEPSNKSQDATGPEPLV